ncbi:CD48 antigen isoform X2 [Oenanthe melanoleuca]|uniref:CD48 antigen isoform X2 n=1 Tax=Oenanthe melanoleuca TaxID=2939378 RepID=UPI0024C1EBC8|nr:CD48 antigen isoform X2 [Oenanthe melanoleuca]
MVLGLKLNLPFLLFIVQAWAQEPQPLEVNGAVGGVAFLNPHSPQDPLEYSQIHWRWKNQVTIAIRKQGQEPRYPQSRFWGRLELFDNHTLKMSNLSLGDSSEYSLYLEDDTGKESVQRVRLRVYGRHLRVDPAPEALEERRPRPERVLQPRRGDLRVPGQQPRVLQQRLADLPAALQLDRGILLCHLCHAQRPGGPGTSRPPLPPAPRGLRTLQVTPPVTSCHLLSPAVTSSPSTATGTTPG